jgi:hypothetical protein
VEWAFDRRVGIVGDPVEIEAAYDGVIRRLDPMTPAQHIRELSDLSFARGPIEIRIEFGDVDPVIRPITEDEWTIPGELTSEAALAYFAKNERFSGGLEICDDDGRLTGFTLDIREVLRRQVGASQRLSAGKLIESYAVRPVSA